MIDKQGYLTIKHIEEITTEEIITEAKKECSEESYNDEVLFMTIFSLYFNDIWDRFSRIVYARTGIKYQRRTVKCEYDDVGVARAEYKEIWNYEKEHIDEIKKIPM